MGRVWRIAKWSMLAIVAIVVAATAIGCGYRSHRLHQLDALPSGRAIREAMFVRIGGIEQWITIRGDDRDNPVLLILHGGPGFAFMSQMPAVFHSWERDFTVVQWDQRGAGRTYRQSGPLASNVSVDRVAQDGIEVADFLRQHLHKPKIVLVGLSWGAMLGIRMAAARPELFYAYVATGLTTNYVQSKRVAYAQLLAEARARGNANAIAELESNGPPPYRTTSAAAVHTKWANAFEAGNASTTTLLRKVLFESPLTAPDVYALVRGIADSQDHFRAEIEHEDLPARYSEFAIPIFVIQGDHDNVAPTPLAAAYVDRMHAPVKALIVIPDAGHNAIVNRGDLFLKQLVDRVRPLARQ